MLLVVCLMDALLGASAQDKEKRPPTPGPMLAQGTVDFDTPTSP